MENITLKDMQEGKTEFGIKEVKELVDLNPGASDDLIRLLIALQYGVEVEEMIVTLARVEF